MRATRNVVVVYYSDDWRKSHPLDSAPPTRESFEDWHTRGLEHNLEMYRASIKWYDVKTHSFKKAWAYRNKKWIKIRKPIKPDLIFDKIKGIRDYQLFDFKMGLAKKVKIFNHPLFRTNFDNKFSQYLFFGEFMPKSFLATTLDEFKGVLKKISSSKVVVKPLYGSGGFGIIIDDKQKVKRGKLDFPVLVQEFIRSERGIPGISKHREIADLRMVFINHKLIYALSRIAKKGSLFTNFHQGATAVLVPQKEIPKSATRIVREVIGKLCLFPEAHYSLDFIFTNSGKPILVEMNTTPGFDLLTIVGNERVKEKNFKEFIKVIAP